jgi:hypothetical protein
MAFALTHEQAMVVQRLLGHHVVAFLDPTHPDAGTIGNLSSALYDYAVQMLDARYRLPIDGLETARSTEGDGYVLLRLRSLTGDQMAKLAEALAKSPATGD